MESRRVVFPLGAQDTRLRRGVSNAGGARRRGNAPHPPRSTGSLPASRAGRRARSGGAAARSDRSVARPARGRAGAARAGGDGSSEEVVAALERLQERFGDEVVWRPLLPIHGEGALAPVGL